MSDQPFAGIAGAPNGVIMVRELNLVGLVAGSPVGVLAGQSGSSTTPPDIVWDWQGKNLYVCTVSGASPGATTWKLVNYQDNISFLNLTVAGTAAIASSASVGGVLTVGSSAAIAANVTIGGNLDVTGTVTEGGFSAGPQFGDYKASGIALEANGWRLCYGQTRPRTDPLWLFIVANSISWPHGNGDGSSTYTMPDLRGRALSGLDNMGGVAANRVTNAVSGITGTTLGAVGGDEHIFAHTHTISDPGHTHTISDPTHTHSLNDPGHTHGVSDPTHSHGYTDPTHNHTASTAGGGGAFGGANADWITDALTATTAAGPSSNVSGVNITINASGTGVSINSAGTSMSNNAASTGVTNQTASTGITGTTTTGAGVAQNMPPTSIANILMYVGA